MTQRAIVAGLTVVLAAAGIAAALDDTDSPYVIRLDLGAEIRALGSDDPFESEPAAERLVALGPVALPALSVALRRESEPTRAGVVDVLLQIEGEAATQLLVEAASDSAIAVRADALLALGMRQAPAAAPIVEAHLDDPAARARRSAALACHALCTSPAALDRLAAMAVRDGEATAAQQSLRTIVGGEAGRAATARAAIERQALPVLTQPGGDPVVRLNAAVTAALAGRREAIPVLLEAAPGAPLATLALGNIPDPAAVAALTRLRDGGPPAQRHAACAALAALRVRNVPGAAEATSDCPPPPR